nr:MAG TPA: hypothetical protein [Caudoviricetes sp.]
MKSNYSKFIWSSCYRIFMSFINFLFNKYYIT